MQLSVDLSHGAIIPVTQVHWRRISIKGELKILGFLIFAEFGRIVSHESALLAGAAGSGFDEWESFGGDAHSREIGYGEIAVSVGGGAVEEMTERGA